MLPPSTERTIVPNAPTTLRSLRAERGLERRLAAEACGMATKLWPPLVDFTIIPLSPTAKTCVLPAPHMPWSVEPVLELTLVQAMPPLPSGIGLNGRSGDGGAGRSNAGLK